MNYYAIRLEPEQSLSIFGLFNAKTTLTWKDLLRISSIKFYTCYSNGVDTRKLYKMQPDIKEWIKHDKVTIEDLQYLEEWHPNPFSDFKCNIGDLVIHRKHLTPKIILNSKLTFTMLVDEYGLTPDLMILLRYSLNDWILLKITESFVVALNDIKFSMIFGGCSRQNVIECIKRHACSTSF